MNHSGSTRTATRSTHPSGWLSFAGALLIVVSFFHLIAGLAALFKPNLYIAGQDQLLVFSYTQWGWLHILFGIILIATATSLFAGRMWARVFTIILAALSAVANFGFIQAYPLWSIMIIVLDILVIYGVAMHGDVAESYE